MNISVGVMGISDGITGISDTVMSISDGVVSIWWHEVDITLQVVSISPINQGNSPPVNLPCNQFTYTKLIVS